MWRLVFFLSLFSFSAFGTDSFSLSVSAPLSTRVRSVYNNVNAVKTRLENAGVQRSLWTSLNTALSSLDQIYQELLDIPDTPSPDNAPTVDANLLYRFYMFFLIGIGFGFGSVFWVIVLWLIFGKGGL